MNTKKFVIVNDIKKLIKDMGNSFKLRKYYNEKTNNGKTYMATVLDKVIFRTLLFVFLILFFYIISESFLFSLIITIQIFILYNLISYRFQKRRLQKKISLVNEQVVLKKIYNELLNHSPHDFYEHIIKILDNYGFHNITKVDRREIDMIGEISKRKIGIKCLQYDSEYKVGVDIVREFFIGLRRFELAEGVLITTSTFSKEVYKILPKLNNYAKIQLIDIKELAEVLKKADMYPSKKEIKKIILDEISENKINLKDYKEVVLSKGKIIKYILLGIIIKVFGKFTPYSIYYDIAAIVVFSLAIISLIMLLINIVRAEEETKEEKVL